MLFLSPQTTPILATKKRKQNRLLVLVLVLLVLVFKYW
jgi:hypothetical protein